MAGIFEDEFDRLQDEIKELKKENKQLKMHRKILMNVIDVMTQTVADVEIIKAARIELESMLEDEDHLLEILGGGIDLEGEKKCY